MNRAASLAPLLVLIVLALAASAALAYKWTFMVYMAADNNLYSYAYMDLSEMMKVGSTKDVAIVVLLDSYNDTCDHLYLVKKGGLEEVMRLPDLDTGSPETLAKFIENATKIAPAEHYCLVLWNHGGGWIGLCVDDDTGNYITLPELREALESSGLRFDVIAFDACLMEMAEVAFELENVTRYVVGSEQVVPAYGYPYDVVLGELTSNPTMTGEELAKAFVAAYASFYSQFTPGPYGYTQSAIDTSKMSNVAKAFSKLAEELMKVYTEKPSLASAIRRARMASTEFYLDYYVDAIDAAAELMSLKKLPASLREAAESAFLAATQAVVANWCSGVEAYGMSIYYPSRSTDWRPTYTETAWARATLWDEWLQVFVSTQLRGRGSS